MRTLIRNVILVTAFGITPLAAQPIGGRQVTVNLVANRQLRGELLTISADSIWVLESGGQTVNAAVTDINRILVQRYSKKPGGALAWGLGVGLASGLGLTAACASVGNGDGCGKILVSMLTWGGVIGGISALSIQMGRYSEVSPAGITAYARFPQGPPPGLDLQRLGVAQAAVP